MAVLGSRMLVDGTVYQTLVSIVSQLAIPDSSLNSNSSPAGCLRSQAMASRGAKVAMVINEETARVGARGPPVMSWYGTWPRWNGSTVSAVTSRRGGWSLQPNDESVIVLVVSYGEVPMSQTGIGVKNVVLVHGGFVDGSGWEGVYRF